MDLSAFAELAEQLGGLDTRANAAAQRTRDLEAERQKREEERRAAMAKYDEQRRACEEVKKPVDAALQAARDRLTEHGCALQSAETRLGAAGAELVQLERQLVELEASTAAARVQQITAARDKQQQLSSEQARLQGELPAARAASKTLAADVHRLWEESQRHQQQIDALEAERKSLLAPMDAALGQVREGLSTTGQEAAAVEQERTERFGQLGLAIYQSQPAEPRLQEAIHPLAALDRARDAASAALASSQGLTQALPHGTMLKFWSTMILAAVVVLGVGFGTAWLLLPSPKQATRRARYARPSHHETTSQPSGQLMQEESEKNAVVSAFVQSRSAGPTSGEAAQKTRERAVDVLTQDLRLAGSSADPTYLPLYTKILKSDEPQLRAAAADAIGMTRPGLAEMPALTSALNDPVPAVRHAALGALNQVQQDPTAQLLVRRVRDASTDRTSVEALTPDPAPDAKQLGVPIYEGATYLYFASNLAISRASFATAYPVQKVLDFYAAKASRPAVPGNEFTRLYFGGSPDDPTGIKRMGAETQTLLQEMIKANKPSTEIQAVADQRAGLELDLPLMRYQDAVLYGSVSFVALEEASSGGAKRATRYVAVFEDHTLGRTGFELHVPPEAKR